MYLAVQCPVSFAHMAAPTPWRRISTLVWLEWQADRHQRSSWAGLLLAVVGQVLVAGLALRGQVTPAVWNALFWLLLAFSGFTVVGRAFLAEPPGRALSFYPLVAPQLLLLARVVYAAILFTLLAVAALGVYGLLMGYLPPRLWAYVGGVAVFSCGLAITLAVLAAVAAQAGGGPVLLVVLGLPVLAPLLLAAIRYGQRLLLGLPVGAEALGLVGLVGFSLVAGLLVFPSIWAD